MRPDPAFPGAWRGRIPALIMVAIAGAAIFSQTSGYGLLGHDSYPIIASSRIESWGDLVGTVTERLMDGRYPGEFYRPLLAASFALDEAIWGFAPFGYQLTNVGLFLFCALALFALAGRLAGSAAGIAAYATLVAFLVHPTHVEVIPVPARRPELLCCAFVALSLWLQLRPRALAADRAPIAPAIATLAAIAAKETAYVLPLLTFVAVFLYAAESSWPGRLRRAARALGPHLVVVLAMLAVRALVLGGLGGHRQVGPGQIVMSVPGYLAKVTRELILPQPVMRDTPLAPLLLLGLTVGLVSTGVLLSLRGSPVGADRSSQIKSAKILVVALTWIVAVGVIYAAAGWIGPWYYLLPVAGWSLLAGGLADRFFDLVRLRAAVRWPAALTLLLLGLLLVWHARLSPVVYRYEEWPRATVASGEFLEEVGRLIDRAEPGSVIAAPPLPYWVLPAADVPTVFGGAVLAPYSVQAWADLNFPRRTIVVEAAPPRDAAAGETVLRITRRLPGF